MNRAEMTEELEAIRKRQIEDKAFCAVMHMEHPPQVQDVATLLKAVDALKAENERLRDALEELANDDFHSSTVHKIARAALTPEAAQ